MNNKSKNDNKLDDYYFIDIGGTNNKSNYFFDEDDFRSFISFIGKINGLVAYCVTTRNVKLLVNETDVETMENNLSVVINSYNECFNYKYGKVIQILNIKPKISELSSFDELLEASKSIHTTPEAWLHHPHSSIRAYLYDDVPEFIDKSHISNIYGSAVEYFEFLNK